ncbi:hypothetical protein YC2023_054030 [Brassica napus]
MASPFKILIVVSIQHNAVLLRDFRSSPTLRPSSNSDPLNDGLENLNFQFWIFHMFDPLSFE